MSRRRAPTVPVRQIVSIVMLLACMIGILVLKSRCGAAVGNLLHAIDTAPGRQDGGPADGSDGKTRP